MRRPTRERMESIREVNWNVFVKETRAVACHDIDIRDLLFEIDALREEASILKHRYDKVVNFKADHGFCEECSTRVIMIMQGMESAR